MKNTLTLGTIMLGCCLIAVGQTSSSSGGTTVQGSQDQYSQGATGSGSSDAGYSGQLSGSQSAGQNQSTAMSENQNQAANKTSLSGCLTRAADGNYMIADLSGNSFQLTGDTAELSKYVGQEVRVEGVQSSSQAPGAMSSAPGGQQQFSVSRVHKIASNCQSKTGTSGTSGGSNW